MLQYLLHLNHSLFHFSYFLDYFDHFLPKSSIMPSSFASTESLDLHFACLFLDKVTTLSPVYFFFKNFMLLTNACLYSSHFDHC